MEENENYGNGFPLDDLKSNFRSWETDCEKDGDELYSILKARHPHVDQNKLQELAYDWVGAQKYYQPSLSDLNKVYGLFSFEVFASKQIAQKAFPNVEILTYYGDDIEELIFVDHKYS